MPLVKVFVQYKMEVFRDVPRILTALYKKASDYSLATDLSQKQY